MIKYALFLVLITSFVGCKSGGHSEREKFAASHAKYQQLATELPPSTWKAKSAWTFTVTNKNIKLNKSVVFRITDEPAVTCLSGKWKKLEVLSETGFKTSNPAYFIEGRNLQILLSSALCDSYNEFIGELGESGFVGNHTFSTMTGGDSYGPVLGVPAQ